MTCRDSRSDNSRTVKWQQTVTRWVKSLSLLFFPFFYSLICEVEPRGGQRPVLRTIQECLLVINPQIIPLSCPFLSLNLWGWAIGGRSPGLYGPAIGCQLALTPQIISWIPLSLISSWPGPRSDSHSERPGQRNLEFFILFYLNWSKIKGNEVEFDHSNKILMKNKELHNFLFHSFLPLLATQFFLSFYNKANMRRKELKKIIGVPSGQPWARMRMNSSISLISFSLSLLLMNSSLRAISWPA